jgi:hypothetical protein
MLNGTLVASVAGNALTIAVKTLAGNNPSSSDPVFFLFRDASAGYAVIEQTAALSITVPSGATLGTVSGQANRIWVGVFNNSGTAVLGVYNSLSGTNILCWDETSPANGTGLTGSSTSPQVWYAASTLSSVVFRILGYVESTQATAGTWAASPSKVQLFAPAVKRPGDVVQEVSNRVTGGATTTSATYVALTNENVTVNVQSAGNVIRVEAAGTMAMPDISGNVFTSVTSKVTLSRGAVANTNLFGSVGAAHEAFGQVTGAQAGAYPPVSLIGYDVPNVAGNVTYAVQGQISGGFTLTYSGDAAQLVAREIQI